VTAYLEVWTPTGAELVPLEGTRLSVGQNPSSDITLSFDKTVSNLHAVFERLGGAWTVRDLGSRNGTRVNAHPIVGDRALRHGDEIEMGSVRLVYRSSEAGGDPPTEAAEAAPEVSPREREVLLALCRPVLSGSVLSDPPSVRDVASELVITESAVKKHLGRLYDKFDLYDDDRRRGRLAHEAVRRGAVTLADLRKHYNRS
jgi:pSer/pThr/pTyr-binding forkhead associated (FHA) protein